MFFHLCKALFFGFLQFQGNFVDGRKKSKYRDAPLLFASMFLLYCRYTSNSDYLTTDDLLLFLEAEQGVMFHTHCLQRKKTFSLGEHSEFIYEEKTIKFVDFFCFVLHSSLGWAKNIV